MPIQASPPAYMGMWAGEWVHPPQKSSWQNNPSLVARVVGLGGDRYEVQLLDAFHRRTPPIVSAEFEADSDQLSIQKGDWFFEITADSLTGGITDKKHGKVEFKLEKTTLASPTLGKAAPEGAITLLEGNSLEQWMHRPDKEPTWKISEDGIMTVYPKKSGNKKGGDLFTRQKFLDCELHLEFKLPYLPKARGQDRSNSGIFFQNIYEVQILDSFGFESGWRECGALYKVSPSKVNASAPPGEWQTYDITFKAARMNQDGIITENPRITVRHNGILIHHDQEIPEITSNTEKGRKQTHLTQPGSFKIQDHGQAIEFRNIWIKPIMDIETL
ncbi:MAG: DUF1080 domain-containing protein [Verrucomicrobiota bacterium]